ncbi:putative transketolase N-terminal section [[Clostridium] cellulosi]|jgi:Transketolase, thiamine diphosphate binding domain.|uniref:Putative transketolase N-terminal section n=1 Tax=[Clostridium] cellulosi TaxID=29343 RepID=A0A078KQH1_9FIRM|nr:MAG: transketolase [[Clostridium] cellulosi]CDZ24693.1 putative transketolase N-terminal section [[Clostridium] cellulosi]
MDRSLKKQLSVTALNIRKLALTAVYSAKSGHPGGSLSISDVLAYLYFKEMNVDPKNPTWEDRDRLVLSKGHCAPALYSALALKGYFPVDEVKNFRKLGSMLQGHPDMKGIPGVDMSTGSLGQGISAAAGIALSAKLSNKDYRVYAILGDGEIEEGQVWEAAMFAAQYKLDNLCAYVDNNGLQIDGKIDDVMSPYPITDKFKAFGWNVIEADAHDFDDLERAYNEARACKGKPSVIVAHSVKGKGVSFMENKAEWHGSAPNTEQYEQALKELDDSLAKLEVQ